MIQPPFKARRDSYLIPLLYENTSIVKSSSLITSATIIPNLKIVYAGTLFQILTISDSCSKYAN
jgi:hypothetical protein